jgi:SAM-dependent methyltransferase
VKLRPAIEVLGAGPRYALYRAYHFLRQPVAKCSASLPALLQGRGLEVGGPSKLFYKSIPVYEFAQLDNCVFRRDTIWSRTNGETFRYANKTGTLYIREASDLGFPDRWYDYIISSHMLEHSTNPIKVLKEWHRVLRNYLLLVVPEGHRTITPDRHKPITEAEHMISDYHQGIGEDDKTHTSDDKNYQTRAAHHHVFNEANARRIVEYSGFRVVSLETLPPFHIVILASKS